jgi:flagellar hook protein FlgE
MMRSLFAGVSGLRNHQVRMDVIGNNVANVNTVAFKSGRVTFKEGFAQLLQGASRPPGDHGGINPIQIGLGMQVGSIDTLFTQGNIETTGIATDLAIQGDSFFVVAKGNEHYYTRSGNFQMDADGRLVSPTNGFVVQGRMAVNGVLQDGITDIRLPFGQKTAAQATTGMKLAGNLNAAAPRFAGPLVTEKVEPARTENVPADYAGYSITAQDGVMSANYALFNDGGEISLYRNGEFVGSRSVPTTGNDPLTIGGITIQPTGGGWAGAPALPTAYSPAVEFQALGAPSTHNAANARSFTSSSIGVYDSLGAKHELKLTMWKTADDTWSWRVDEAALAAAGIDPATISGAGEFQFNEDGTLLNPTPVTIKFKPAGAQEVSITLDPGSGVNGISHYATSNTAVLRDQDGYTMGMLQNFSIDRQGTITGAYTNGTTQTLGQIVLSDFNNPSGLLRVGDNMYAVSGNSGGAVLGFALEGSQSFLTSGALEMSNVDLAQEFTSMIVAQRGFQANGRVITNSDEMMQEVVNLKR